MNLRELSDSEDEHVVFPGDSFQTPDTFASFTDDSTRNYTPSDISFVADILLSENIPCFIVGSAALRYYGCRLVLSFVAVAVPHAIHERATCVLAGHDDLLNLGLKSAWASAGPSLHYPEFKLRGTTLNILLVPDFAWGLRCEPANIHLDSTTKIPYPTLGHFAQSFLRTKDVNCLELLVDGQDSSLEWGIGILDFGGHSWKRAVWEKTVMEKQKRIPREKPTTLYSTRFRRKTEEL